MGIRLSVFLLSFAAACVGEDSRIGEQRDAARGRVWVLTRSVVVVHEPGRSRRVPLPGWIYAGLSGCARYLGVGGGGEAVVTSDVLPVVWRIDPASFAVTRHELELDADRDKDIGFTGLSWSAKEGAWLAFSTVDGALWTIDAALRSARKLGRGSFRDGCAARARGL